MKRIPLTQGQFAFVDDDDFESLNQHKWHAVWKSDQLTFYAQRCVGPGGNQTLIAMHRVILGLEPGDPRKGDHADRNGLNNQRHNLRIATNAQNAHNARKPRSNTTGFKNVTLHKPSGQYHVRVMVNGKRIHGGCFDDPQEAAFAAKILIEQHHGEFARTE